MSAPEPCSVKVPVTPSYVPPPGTPTGPMSCCCHGDGRGAVSHSPVVGLQVWPAEHVDVLTQAPLLHTSLVHAIPSLHGPVLLVNTQPVAGLHVSVVHTLLSLQTSAVPAVQVPFWHVSAPLQRFPSLHDVPFATRPFAGHAADDPEQVSARSHAPTAARQTVPALANWHPLVQHAPPSHCSPASTVPLPHNETPLTVMVTPWEAVPLRWSVTVNTAWNGPCDAYVCTGLTAVEVVPSPKSQL